MSFILSFLIEHWFESLAALLGFISIYLQIKQNAWYWPISIIMVMMYVVVYYNTRFYADMSLQFYFLFVGIYGWYYWISGKKTKLADGDEHKKVVSLNKKEFVLAGVISLIFFGLIYLILSQFTNSDIPLGDAFTTGLSFVATWLLARKILENWIIWIIVDIVSTGLYIYKELYPTAILFFVLSILAFVGYYKWKKSMQL